MLITAAKFVLYCGVPNNILSVDAEVSLATLAIDFGYTGGSIAQGTGFWKDDHGVIIQERSVVLTLITNNTSKADIRALCNAYNSRFDQDCVLLEHSTVIREYVSREEAK